MTIGAPQKTERQSEAASRLAAILGSSDDIIQYSQPDFDTSIFYLFDFENKCKRLYFVFQ